MLAWQREAENGLSVEEAASLIRDTVVLASSKPQFIEVLLAACLHLRTLQDYSTLDPMIRSACAHCMSALQRKVQT